VHSLLKVRQRLLFGFVLHDSIISCPAFSAKANRDIQVKPSIMLSAKTRAAEPHASGCCGNPHFPACIS
jgi:hypothetical protein